MRGAARAVGPATVQVAQPLRLQMLTQGDETKAQALRKAVCTLAQVGLIGRR